MLDKSTFITSILFDTRSIINHIGFHRYVVAVCQSHVYQTALFIFVVINHSFNIKYGLDGEGTTHPLTVTVSVPS